MTHIHFEGVSPSENPNLLIDYRGIKQILPHRYPFLFVDGIKNLEKEKWIEGYKHFTYNEEFFNGHFPAEPVVPGVIQIEALAQVSCILLFLSYQELKGKRPAFTGMDAVKFRKPVRPGDSLTLKAQIQNFRRGFAVLEAVGTVGDQVVVEAIIKASAV